MFQQKVAVDGTTPNNDPWIENLVSSMTDEQTAANIAKELTRINNDAKREVITWKLNNDYIFINVKDNDTIPLVMRGRDYLFEQMGGTKKKSSGMNIEIGNPFGGVKTRGGGVSSSSSSGVKEEEGGPFD
jgi:hypothetical protein